MNKCASLILTLSTLFLAAGCLSIPENYTPPTPLVRNSGTPQYDVTFSLSYESDGRESTGRASDARLREMINERLLASNHFSSVMYKDLKEKSNYHIHVKAHYSMQPEYDTEAQEVLVVCTLGLIPTWQNMYLDLTATTYLHGQKIHSIATSENLKCYIWLPLAPIGLIWNNYFAWTDVENNCLNYLINHLTQAQQNLNETTPWKRKANTKTSPQKTDNKTTKTITENKTTKTTTDNKTTKTITDGQTNQTTNANKTRPSKATQPARQTKTEP